MGKQDIPIIQKQPPFRVDLLESNIILFGSAMSGKTNFLKLIITSLHKTRNVNNENIFILDFGGALSEDYENLPLVAACFDNSNEEYVKRVFRLMENQLRSNISKLKGKNFQSDECESIPHTTLIIDNINLFLDEPRYTAYRESLFKICRDGLSKGITVVATASSIKGFGSMLNSFKQKIALEMPAESYSEIFGSKTISVGTEPGRGIANITLLPDADWTFPSQRAYEVLLYEAEKIDDDFMEKVKAKFKTTVKKYIRFPDTLSENEYKEITGNNPDNTNIGLDYTECKPVSIDLKKTRAVAMYDRKTKLNIDTLDRLLEPYYNKDDVRICILDDGRKELLKISEKTSNCEYIQSKDNNKHSPLQQLIGYIHCNITDLSALTIPPYNNSVLSICRRDLASDNPIYENKTTIFVLHSKQLYTASNASEIFLSYIFPELKSLAEEYNLIFIFSDVKSINSKDSREALNSNIDVALLFDNISEFVNDRGNNSVFGYMDVKALKEEYARCEDGDGYYYNIDEDDLKKVRFITNQSEE